MQLDDFKSYVRESRSEVQRHEKRKYNAHRGPFGDLRYRFPPFGGSKHGNKADNR